MIRNIDLFVKEEKSFRVNGPTWGWRVELHRCNGVRAEWGLDVRVELLNVHNDFSMKDGDREECCLEG